MGDYRDPERGLELGHLMREVAAVPGVERVRLSSVEVIHVRDSLLDALAEEPRICPHLHVPLQSGDDAVLASMGRHYDAAGYAAAIARLRARVPHVNVTTDVIVGYPTEDDAAFERTLDLVRATGITKVHTFSFSARPGTEADRLGDPVPPEEKKRRSRELRGLSEALGPPPPRGEARHDRGGAGRQGRGRAGVGLQPRLHALVPAGRRGDGGRSRHGPRRRAPRRRLRRSLSMSLGDDRPATRSRGRTAPRTGPGHAPAGRYAGSRCTIHASGGTSHGARIP